MTPRQVIRSVFRAILVVVLIASGTYLLVYLYRWEWNRALISGLFFVIAEIALASATTGRRLHDLERAVAERRSQEALDTSGRSEADAPAPIFPWLEPGSLGVFIPVLLGVGAILSALAYVVERVAAATTDGDRRGREPALTLPDADLLSTSAEAPVDRPVRRTGTGRGVAAWIAAVLVIAVIVTTLATVAMNRQDPRSTSGSTAFVLEVDARTGPADPRAVAETLWITCRAHLPHEVELAGIGAASWDVAVLEVRPRLGRNDARRFAGCLGDLRFDRVLTSVQEVIPRADPAIDAGGQPS
jgi:hypothetical protein